MTSDSNQLVYDLRKAHYAAKAVQCGDGGSMSADMIYIPVGKRHRIRRFSQKLDDLTGGHRISTSYWHGYLICPAGSGVASRRLAACEAAAEVLKRSGWEACVFYQMD